MSRLSQIRKELSLPSHAQNAWSALSIKERKVFIALANLNELESELTEKSFDKFNVTYQRKISKAIQLASNIAQKFNAHLKPVSVSGAKELKVA